MPIEYDREDLMNAGKRRPPREREDGSPRDWPRLQRGVACPSCGRDDGQCRVGVKEIEGWCFYPDSGKGHYFLDGYEAGPRRGSTIPRGVRIPKQATVPAKAVIPDDVLNKAYRAALAALPLSREHLTALLARGFSESAARWFGTLPKGRPARAAAKAAAEAACGRTDVPFVTSLLREPAGILCPFAQDDEVVGVQIRPDVTRDGRKYVWAAGATARVHHIEPAMPRDPRTWITEGPIKAELASRHFGACFVALPGVSAGHEEAVAVAVRRQAPVVIAFDADWRSNRDVARALNRLASRLSEAGVETLQASWDAVFGKGIDDMLAAGGAHTLALTPFSPVEIPEDAAGAADDPARETRRKERHDRADVEAFRATERKLLDAAAALLKSNGDDKKAKRFRRAAMCGRPEDHDSCGGCNAPIGVTKLVAESPICSHCALTYLYIMTDALMPLWPDAVTWFQVPVATDDPEDCRKTQATVKRVLAKVDKALPGRIRSWRGPGMVGFATADLDDLAKIGAAGYKPERLDKKSALERVHNVIHRRYRYIRQLVRDGDVKSLIANPWLDTFVSVTAGQAAKKAVPWLSPKGMRKHFRIARHGDEVSSIYNTTDCCDAVHKHHLVDGATGRLVAMRIRKPFNFNEGFRMIESHLAEVAAGTWEEPTTLAGRADRAKAASSAVPD